MSYLLLIPGPAASPSQKDAGDGGIVVVFPRHARGPSARTRASLRRRQLIADEFEAHGDRRVDGPNHAIVALLWTRPRFRPGSCASMH